MKMVSAGAGLGVSVNDYRVVTRVQVRKGFHAIFRFRLVVALWAKPQNLNLANELLAFATAVKSAEDGSEDNSSYEWISSYEIKRAFNLRFVRHN